jgi:D-3-phosphoglycerate dehydrogenase / 2-oxoglutarate reductase
MSKKVAITTTTFAKDDTQSLDLLRQNGLELIFNGKGRPLTKEETMELVADCVGVIAGSEPYDHEVILKLKELKVISRVGSGMDNVDLHFCQQQKIQVFGVGGGPVKAVAELTIGLILNCLRQISLMDRNLHEGVWQKKMGSLFEGKTLGIVGLGRIGCEVAKLGKALGAEIIYSDPHVDGKEYSHYKKVNFETLLKQSDIITLHIPLTDDVKNLIGEKEFSLMKKTAILINCSRGEIIDEDILYKVLKDGQLQAAAIDVFHKEPYDGPLKELDNVILTPHIGSYAKEVRIQMELEAAKNLIKGLKGK